MSKGFNMIGWRMAFVAGHPKIVQAFADVKDNSDSGQFMAIQQAAAAALRASGNRRRRSATKYRRRSQKLVAALQQGRLPGEDAGRHLLPLRRGAEGLRRPHLRQRRGGVAVPDHEQSVCCVPWDDAGAYLRFSVTYLATTEAEEDALMARRSSDWGGWGCSFE